MKYETMIYVQQDLTDSLYYVVNEKCERIYPTGYKTLSMAMKKAQALFHERMMEVK